MEGYDEYGEPANQDPAAFYQYYIAGKGSKGLNLDV